MPDHIQDLPIASTAARLDALEHEVRDLTRRLALLEAQRAAVATPATALPEAPHAPEPRVAMADMERAHPMPATGTLLTLIGRTLLVLAGGFMVRAITDAGLLPALAGVALGLAYAAAWIVLADREAAAGRFTSAVFQGVAGGLLAYPLLWETSTRFQLLPVGWALGALVTVFAGALFVAQRHGSSALALIQTVLATFTALGLLFATREVAAAALALLAIATLVEVLAWRDLWTGLRWPAAALLDIALLILIWLGGRPEGLPEGYPPLRPNLAVTAVLLLPALYLVSIFVRTLRRGFGVVPFEVAQGAAALLIGLGGAERLLAARSVAPTVAGLVTLVLGAACYAAAFAFIERHGGRGRNFYFYSSAAGLLVLIGTGRALGATLAALAWLLLALTAAWCLRRFERVTLGYHAAAYLGAAMAAAGLLETCGRGLAGAAAGVSFPSPTGWLVAAVAPGIYALLATTRGGGETPWWRRVPAGLSAVLLVPVAGGLAVAALAAALQPTPALQAAAVATLRTAVLAALALGLAFVGRRRAWPELTWMVYPLLLLGGVKLLLEDLPAGRPATLFLSFVLYGGALLLAPRLLRQHGDDVTLA